MNKFSTCRKALISLVLSSKFVDNTTILSKLYHTSVVRGIELTCMGSIDLSDGERKESFCRSGKKVSVWIWTDMFDEYLNIKLAVGI